MNKHRLVKILTLLVAITSLTACGGNKDTAVIVNIQDSGNDTSQNDVIDNTKNNSQNNTENNKQNEDTNTETVEAEENNTITLSLGGKWADSDSNIYAFKQDNKFYGYNSDTETDLNGTYETDESTYLKIHIISENGIDTDKNLEYKLSTIEEKEDTDGENEIVVSLISGETTIELVKLSEIKEQTEEEKEANKVVVEELTGERLEEVRQELINMGINPDTGLTFEEEAAMLSLTPAVEQPPVEQPPVEQPQ